MEEAIVLWSGGLDSTTCLAWAKERGFKPVALSFKYGQRHDAVLDLGARECEALQHLEVTEHITLVLPTLGDQKSSLTSKGLEPSKDLDATRRGIPDTYVPARNMVFLSHAVSFAENRGVNHVVAGMNALDWSGYPDCRPSFVNAFQVMVNEGTKDGDFEIHAPLIDMTKVQIIELGLSLGVDYALTSSCYSPVGWRANACGRCDSCQIRLAGFVEAGLEDPALYA